MCFSAKTPAPPPQPVAPTVGSSINDYVNAYPQLNALNQKYGPQEAQQAYDLFKQYAPLYTQTQNQVDQQTAPYTAGLQEVLAKQATDYLNGGTVPDSLKASYQDQLRSELGPNAGSGIGADYVSRGLLNLNQQYKQYYNDLGLSLANRQPLNNTANPQFSNPSAGANNALNFNQGVYGTTAGIYNNLFNTQTQASTARRGQNFQLMGTALGTAGAFAGGL